mgnify:CR=1 FL=1
MDKIKNVRPCYTQKVIPLAFDESLSYYENVCNLVAKMNEIIDFANNELSDKLNTYIDSRFNDIMIDTMYEGETETLIMYINKGGNVNG